MNEDLFLIGEENAEDLTFSCLGAYPRVRKISYSYAMSGTGVIASDSQVMLCFPYSLWDSVVEKKDVLYGMREFGCSIRDLAEAINGMIERRFPNARYVNHPLSILIERDKLKTKRILSAEGVVVAQDIRKDVKDVLDAVEEGSSVYIKARYGSMGKGITYVSRRKWTTNFKYDGNRIWNHEQDTGWKEIDITGDAEFLKRILEEDVVVERGVVNSMTNGLKFDLRARVLFGGADLEDAYGRGTDKNSITNIVQGAEMMPVEDMKQYVPAEKLEEGVEVIRRSAGILGLNYAGGDILFEGNDFKPVFIEINSFPGIVDTGFFEKVYNSIERNMLS